MQALNEKMSGYETVNLKGYESLNRSQYRTKMSLASNGKLVFSHRSECDSFDVYWVRDLSSLETLTNAGIIHV